MMVPRLLMEFERATAIATDCSAWGDNTEINAPVAYDL
jgi:hypothetical protein